MNLQLALSAACDILGLSAIFLSRPQNLALLVNPTSKELTNDSPLDNCFLNNSLYMARLNPPVPDPLPGQSIRCHRWRNVDDHVASELMASNMTNESDPDPWFCCTRVGRSV